MRPRSLTAFALSFAGHCTACGVCEPQCEDWLEVIPSVTVDSGSWPPTNTYRIEILVGSSRFECSGYFKAENDDEWMCSDGVEAISGIKWEMPTFIIDRTRDEVGELETVHVKIWREGVVIFDEDVDIRWDRANDASTDVQPCANLGCWSGIIRASIPSFEGLEEGT